MFGEKLSSSLHWGLNPGPSVYKTDALPLSYRGLQHMRARVLVGTEAGERLPLCGEYRFDSLREAPKLVEAPSLNDAVTATVCLC